MPATPTPWSNVVVTCRMEDIILVRSLLEAWYYRAEQDMPQHLSVEREGGWITLIARRGGVGVFQRVPAAWEHTIADAGTTWMEPVAEALAHALACRGGDPPLAPALAFPRFGALGVGA